MRVRLDYGIQGMEVDLVDDNVIGVLGLSPAPPLDDPQRAVYQALRSPLGARPLAEVAQGKESVAIVVCDITRPVPNRVLLPPILNTLADCHIPAEAITILIATGTHRPNLGVEIEVLVGADIAARYTVLNHECKNMDSHTWLGESPAGVPVWIDRRYLEADLKITVGLIEPHFMAGYSGGRKLIMPGLAAMETIQRWHCPRFLESPFASSGIVARNPVHAEALAIARLAPPDMIVDVILDEDNRITGIFAGEMECAWQAGTESASRQVRAEVLHAADIVVTSGAGYPLDQTFYQAVKGMVAAIPAVKPGGTIVIAAACTEGIGSADFRRTLFDATDLEAFVREISMPEIFLPEAWQVEELARVVRHAEVLFVTDGIDASELERCFVTPLLSVDTAMSMAFAKHGPDATVIAIPRGPYVIPTACQPQGAP